MKKIIVLGHPQSGYEKVESLLLHSGMAAAKSTQRDQHTPQQITNILLKVHGAAPVEQIQNDDALPQLEVAPVWQGMVLDLMLSNLDQSLWGWADPQVIYLLNYWKEQDPQVVFVLVYDAPSTVLTRLSFEDAAAPQPQLQQRLQSWVAYNSTLLEFYLRNSQRCVLVHASQVAPSAKNYLQLLNTHIGEQAAALQLAAPESIATPSDTLGSSQPAQILLAHLLQTYPQAQALYEELQAAATLPSISSLALNCDESPEKHFLAWKEFVQLYQQAQAAQKVCEAEATDEAQLQLRLENVQKELTEENEQLLRQLHQVQEELESYHLQYKKITQEALQAEKNKKIIIPAELEEENELLLHQLHLVQEELERYFLENQKLKAGGAVHKSEAKGQLSTAYQYGAADRIKNQLSYRLGATMIEKSRSLGGWFSMPFALKAETQRFRQELAVRKDKKLPPIKSYADAHEAERVKQHLSYRLGSTMIQHSSSLSGWFSMPWALYTQMKEFRQSRR